MKELPLFVVYVEACIFDNESNVLIAQRSRQDDQSAGDWSFPGGKIEEPLPDHNALEDTLIREVREEVGLEISDINYFQSRSFKRSSGHMVVGINFTAKHSSGIAMPLEDQHAVRWVSIDDAVSIMPEHRSNLLRDLKSLYY